MSAWILVPLLVFGVPFVFVFLMALCAERDAGPPVYSLPSSSRSREEILRDLYAEDVLTLEQYERALVALGLYPYAENLHPVRPSPMVGETREDRTREDRTVVEIEIRIPR